MACRLPAFKVSKNKILGINLHYIFILIYLFIEFPKQLNHFQFLYSGLPPGGPMGPPMFSSNEQHGGGSGVVGDAHSVNGMWMGPGSNMKNKVSGPTPNSIVGEQQLSESGMVCFDLFNQIDQYNKSLFLFPL